MKNKYCESSSLSNEADVELFFLAPLLKDFGYQQADIKPKKSLEEISVGKLGSRRAVKHRPDFAIKIGRHIRVIVEAKAPTESLDDHVLQPRDYCASLNGARRHYRPVKYFLLTNGNETRVYDVDLNAPIGVLKFKEFDSASPKFHALKKILSRDALEQVALDVAEPNTLEMHKAPLKDVNEAFAWCHQYIYKTDNISQGAAFMEFVKIIALKLLSDKRIRAKHPALIEQPTFNVPLTDVSFSKTLLLNQEAHTPNPLSTIWFDSFIKEMEKEIAKKKKKRIFERSEGINLSPETIKGVVGRLEGLFLFGIDADLNGRLFETFLSATMRGKDLGQYFTPRSVVKLGVKLAQLKVDFRQPEDSDRVYDGCCGTGGFLIDVLADMWHKVNKNPALSAERKESLCNKLATEHIFGADIGRDPNLSRIARLNMYLHGDGGSSIYNIDSLDKDLPDTPTDNPEALEEKAQMRRLMAHHDGFFDVVITNPPFAKKYAITNAKSKEEESTASRILRGYELLSEEGGKERRELRSNLMFIEKYRDFLKPGGRLITVLDDGLLSAQDYGWFRIWLRREFLVRAIVSLPGDAFQRSAARVKTSILVLEKKRVADEIQPDAFMYPCEYVGIDDPSRARTLPIDNANRERAKREIDVVLQELEKFQSGRAPRGKYIVPASRLSDRLDVKHCLMAKGHQVRQWTKAGLRVLSIEDVLEPVAYTENSNNVIECESSTAPEIPLIVRYDGTAEAGEPILPADTQHGKLYRVATDDVVVSNIAASYGSIAVVPKHLNGAVVSNEYTVLRVKEGFDAQLVCVILRSPVVLAELLLVATGANRTRVRWDTMKTVQMPYPASHKAQHFMLAMRDADEREKKAMEDKHREIEATIGSLHLSSNRSQTVLSAFKPPK